MLSELNNPKQTLTTGADDDGISDHFDDAGPVHFPHHALPSLRQQSQNLRLDEHDGVCVAKAGRDQVHDVQAG